MSIFLLCDTEAVTGYVSSQEVSGTGINPSAENRAELKTSDWHVYSLVSDAEEATYDVYVDGKQVLTDQAWGNKSGANTVKLGGESWQRFNMDVRYDPDTGYIGTAIKTGESLLKVSPFDKIFYMKQNGEYRVIPVADKTFIGSEGLFYINYGDKEILSKEVFTVIYRDRIRDKSVYQIKRFRITAFTTDKPYSVVSGPKAKVKKMSIWPSAVITMKFKPGYGYKILEDTVRFADFPIYKSASAAGQKLTGKELQSLSIRQTKDTSTSEEASPSLLDGVDDDK